MMPIMVIASVAFVVTAGFGVPYPMDIWVTSLVSLPIMCAVSAVQDWLEAHRL